MLLGRSHSMEIAARAASAGLTMAATLLGYSLVWAGSDPRHGSSMPTLLMFVLCAVTGAAAAKKLVRFTDKRTCAVVHA
jgi:hypothetical protein